MIHTALLTLVSAAAPLAGAADDLTPIRLPRDPQIAPDGDSIAFSWRGDVWTAPIEGGEATRLTLHPATDGRPRFSPDGETIYFQSDRSGRTQIHAIAADGTGATRQITFDSHRKTLLHASADGESLLVSQSTDRGWHYSESSRLMLIDLDGETPRRRLFDAGVRDGALSPGGDHAAFVRGRSNWNRKGYVGPQAAQLWLADLESGELERLDEDREDYQNVAAMDPMWGPDGKTVYFNSDPQGVFEVHAMDLESREVRQITSVGADGSDDGVNFPSLSADGKTLLFRRAFDLVSFDIPKGKSTPIELFAAGDSTVSAIERVRETSAREVAFTPDGKQIAMVVANDIWVMDRILKEPVKVTADAFQEGSLTFNADGTRLYFVSDANGESDIHEATLPESAEGIWWNADAFEIRQVTDDAAVERDLMPSPNGTHIAFVKGSDLFVMDDDGSDMRRVASMWSAPEFDWSPDGRWLAYETQDDDYNSDIFLVPLDGTREPFNLSRHPDLDVSPRWSLDGKRLAWTGRRDGDEWDIYWVDLSNEAAEATERDETLKKAMEAMKKGKKKGKADKKKDGDDKGDGETKDEAKKEDDDAVKIDFDGIGDRIRRFRNADSFERGLIWFEGGKKLGFSGQVDGENGFFALEFPRPSGAKRVTGSALSAMAWLADSKEFVGHRGGVPATMSKSGKTETFTFNVRSTLDWAAIRQAAFDQGWRAMRDRFYDEAYNNKDWNKIRAKYRPVAAHCLGQAEFTHLCNMMLGELNASHMGHRGGADPLPDHDAQNEWSPTTMHLGVRFDADAEGPGLLVESVIPGSPAARERSRIEAGETILAIDGTPVGPDADVDSILTLDRVRDVDVLVKDAGGDERTVTVRPVSSVAFLLYDEWVEKTRAKVEELSDGKLGYLHIRGMNFTSFRQMEEDIFDAGYGKEGLIIDVRFNGGGSTTDHVMTALTQPVHAITQSRGSGLGYPQDRKIYASWNKPIVLMCNEHSFSNAEILSHAVKQVGRGRLVGMRTAGGVISTGSVRLMDGSSVRMPGRGWYLASDGADMELNGCLPDMPLWNHPTWSSPDGTDEQLVTAVEALTEDVQKEAARPKPEPVPAARLRK